MKLSNKIIMANSTQIQNLKPNTIQISEHKAIGPDSECFIIAEIGQNHQGNLDTAKKLILAAKEAGADCVKFQKTHPPSKFNKQALQRPYINSNSWGKTYGEHKQHLEFSNEDFLELQQFSKNHNIVFSSSAMDSHSLKFLDAINLPFIKIGSGDFHNKLLLTQAIALNKPLIVSTGMSDLNEVVDVYNLLKPNHSNFCLLHCVSSYPTPVDEINLKVLEKYKELFPDINIGYSGHELGTDISVAAVALGAKIIERHFTFDKTWKGSDHICSLTPEEFKVMVCNIRKLETGKLERGMILNKEEVQKALGSFEKKFQKSELSCYEKLGKSVVAGKKLHRGDAINWNNICLKVAEPKGVLGKDIDGIIGKIVKRTIEEDESVLPEDLY